MFSLAGFPPSGGFLAKFYIFKEAVGRGYLALVLAAVANSLVSVYYYLRLVHVMYMKEAGRPGPRLVPLPMAAVAVLSAIVLLLGLFPGPVLRHLAGLFGG